MTDLPDELTLEEYLEMVGNGAIPSLRRGRKRRRSIDYPAALRLQIAAAELPQAEEEYRFHNTRLWRFDFAWPKHMVALEIEGGIWMRTTDGRSKGHAHPKRFIDDCHKYNEAALLGWALIRVTPEMIQDGLAIDWLRRAMRGGNDG